MCLPLVKGLQDVCKSVLRNSCYPRVLPSLSRAACFIAVKSEVSSVYRKRLAVWIVQFIAKTKMVLVNLLL